MLRPVKRNQMTEMVRRRNSGYHDRSGDRRTLSRQQARRKSRPLACMTESAETWQLAELGGLRPVTRRLFLRRTAFLSRARMLICLRGALSLHVDQTVLAVRTHPPPRRTFQNVLAGKPTACATRKKDTAWINCCP
jgi:hypothetical protein